MPAADRDQGVEGQHWTNTISHGLHQSARGWQVPAPNDKFPFVCADCPDVVMTSLSIQLWIAWQRPQPKANTAADHYRLLFAWPFMVHSSLFSPAQIGNAAVHIEALLLRYALEDPSEAVQMDLAGAITTSGFYTGTAAGSSSNAEAFCCACWDGRHCHPASQSCPGQTCAPSPPTAAAPAALSDGALPRQMPGFKLAFRTAPVALAVAFMLCVCRELYCHGRRQPACQRHLLRHCAGLPSY